jgi:hypothetical protein
MPTETDDAILRSILEEDNPPEPDEAAIQAALADPVLSGIIARATARHAGLLTEKGLERTRRTLAVTFLTDPRAVSLLASARADDASATLPTGKTSTEAPRRRQKSKP